MDGFEQVSAEAGSGQNDCSSASEASPNGNATDGAFLARTKKWREEALRHPDDQLACIGAVNSGAARILNAHWFAIEHAIETCKKSLLEEPSIQGAIVAYTGLLRQLHSMMSFQARLEQKRLDAEKREVQRELDPLLRRAR
jgi:hypothetical protein